MKQIVREPEKISGFLMSKNASHESVTAPAQAEGSRHASNVGRLYIGGCMANKNEMAIPLIEGFRLKADDGNWIVEQCSGKNKKTGEDVYRVFGYYQKIGIALHEVFTVCLRRSTPKDVANLVEIAESVANKLLQASKAIDSWGLKSENAQKVF